MSRNSKQFRELKRRIDYLSAHYLPISSTTGNYTRKEKDAIRSFLLLSHAEFEYYFEEIGWQVAKQALDRWLANHEYKSKVLLYLSTFIETTEKIRQAESSEEKIKAIVGKYYVKNIKANNGIKEDSILNILCPIGVDYDQIDSAWLSTITSFGASRGEIAHTSARIQTLKDPSDIKNDITYIMNELTLLDIYILTLR